MTRSQDEKSIAIKMNSEFIVRLDRLAELVKIPRSRLAKNLVEVGMEELEIWSCVGVLQLAILVSDFTKNKPTARPKDPVSGDNPIPIFIHESDVLRLDNLAAKAGISRHQLIKNLLRVGVEEGEVMARMGMLKFVVLMRDLPAAFHEVCKMGDRALRAGK